MRRFTLLFVASLAAVVAASPCLAAFNATEVFIASTGRGAGLAGSEWYTTLWAHNPTGSAANVQFSFLLRGQTNPATPYIYNEVIPAGTTRRYDNAVYTMFGIEGFGAIRVVSDQPLMVNSRIYSAPEGGEERDTVGQFFAAVPASFAISAGYSTRLLGVYQTVPTDDSQFRYNFGFVESAGGTVTVQVSVYDGADTLLDSKLYTLGAYEVRQYVFSAEFPSISTTNARLLVAATGGSGRVIAFGSGLANASNDPSTFEMAFSGELLGSGMSSVVHDATLTGDGTAGSPLGVANNGITSAKIQDGQVGTNDLAAGAVIGTKVTLPLTLAGASAKTLEVTNNYAGGIAGATFRATNTATGQAIAGYFQAQGGDGTLIVAGTGTGPLLKGFGANGGNDEFRFDNNGTLRMYNPSWVETIKLDPTTGKGTFGSIAVSGHSNASIPIAYGSFNSDGSKFSGTSNISCSWEAANNRYLVTVSGETYEFQDYVVQVALVAGGTARFISTGDVGSAIAVYFQDPELNRTQNMFHIVVYKP